VQIVRINYLFLIVLLIVLVAFLRVWRRRRLGFFVAGSGFNIGRKYKASSAVSVPPTISRLETPSGEKDCMDYALTIDSTYLFVEHI
jgi:hypothetical protein